MNEWMGEHATLLLLPSVVQVSFPQLIIASRRHRHHCLDCPPLWASGSSFYAHPPPPHPLCHHGSIEEEAPSDGSSLPLLPPHYDCCCRGRLHHGSCSGDCIAAGCCGEH